MGYQFGKCMRTEVSTWFFEQTPTSYDDLRCLWNQLFRKWFKFAKVPLESIAPRSLASMFYFAVFVSLFLQNFAIRVTTLTFLLFFWLLEEVDARLDSKLLSVFVQPWPHFLTFIDWNRTVHNNSCLVSFLCR